MADEVAQQPPPPSPDGSPANPLVVTIAGTQPGAPVIPTEGLDETVEGGRYIVNGVTVDAYGEQVKTGRGR